MSVYGKLYEHSLGFTRSSKVLTCPAFGYTIVIHLSITLLCGCSNSVVMC